MDKQNDNNVCLQSFLNYTTQNVRDWFWGRCELYLHKIKEIFPHSCFSSSSSQPLKLVMDAEYDPVDQYGGSSLKPENAKSISFYLIWMQYHFRSPDVSSRLRHIFRSTSVQQGLEIYTCRRVLLLCYVFSLYTDLFRTVIYIDFSVVPILAQLTATEAGCRSTQLFEK